MTGDGCRVTDDGCRDNAKRNLEYLIKRFPVGQKFYLCYGKQAGKYERK